MIFWTSATVANEEPLFHFTDPCANVYGNATTLTQDDLPECYDEDTPPFLFDKFTKLKKQPNVQMCECCFSTVHSGTELTISINFMNIW